MVNCTCVQEISTSAGTTTSSNVIPLVSDARCPILISLRPRITPGESASTMKPENAFPGGHLGSGLVRARTKYLQEIFKINAMYEYFNECNILRM